MKKPLVFGAVFLVLYVLYINYVVEPMTIDLRNTESLGD